MESEYDCAIIGGGLAGLALSILLARQQKKVMLFEKEQYPFHKVCGEYISSESLPFLKSLGVDLQNRRLPDISGLLLSSPSGTSVKIPLDIGGAGLSRYQLDLELFQTAIAAGVHVRTNTRVLNYNFENETCTLTTKDEKITCRMAAGAFGKNANIDVQLNRKYKAPDEKRHFVAVKHHVRLKHFDPSQVEMHLFKGGYCGLSAIEENIINLSYITKTSNLKQHGSIKAMEQSVLSRNPFLQRHLAEAEFLFEKPLTISNLYFSVKEPVHSHLLMLGDAAGNIAPLSGNGMSMALQSAKIASEQILDWLDGKTSREEMEQNYSVAYMRTFSHRIRAARQINWLFLHSNLSNLALPVFRMIPGLIAVKSKSIHGQEF